MLAPGVTLTCSSAWFINTGTDIYLFASILSSTMYVFGGFNSLLLSDILKYTPERCEAFANESACVRAGPGVRCVWAATSPRCVPWEMATVEQKQKVFEDCPPKSGMWHVLSVPLPKGRVGSVFSKFCLLLVVCYYQIKFKMGGLP